MKGTQIQANPDKTAWEGGCRSGAWATSCLLRGQPMSAGSARDPASALRLPGSETPKREKLLLLLCDLVISTPVPLTKRESLTTKEAKASDSIGASQSGLVSRITSEFLKDSGRGACGFHAG